ncbi:glycosyltransferase [bacterium]|nr:glycosyltransferase [bacterium]
MAKKEDKHDAIRIAMVMGKWNGGGIESTVMNYYRHMDRSVVQFDFIYEEGSTSVPVKEVKELGGKLFECPDIRDYSAYLKAMEAFFSESDYKIVDSNINEFSVLPLKAAKKVGIPIRIAHSYCASPYNGAIRNNFKLSMMGKMLKPQIKNYANVYLASTEYAGEWLFGKGADFTVVNNAIDINRFKYDGRARRVRRKEAGIKDDTLVIGHIGKFVEQKNHKYLIDIFDKIHKKNPNSILRLVGGGPLVDSIKAHVKELGLVNCVEFLGQIDDPEKFYLTLDIFLLPSLYENLPLVSVEAQASGLLCFFTDEMPREAQILDSTAFMSVKDAPSKWASAILEKNKTFKRVNTRDILSASNFDIKKEANKLQTMYLDLLESELVQ